MDPPGNRLFFEPCPGAVGMSLDLWGDCLNKILIDKEYKGTVQHDVQVKILWRLRCGFGRDCFLSFFHSLVPELRFLAKSTCGRLPNNMGEHALLCCSTKHHGERREPVFLLLCPGKGFESMQR